MGIAKNKTKKQESPWSFRPDDDVRELLDFAKHRTGMTTSELVNEAVKKCGAAVLDEYFERLAGGRGEFVARFGDDAKAYRVSSSQAAMAAGIAAADAAALAALEASQKLATAQPNTPAARPLKAVQKPKGGPR